MEGHETPDIHKKSADPGGSAEYYFRSFHAMPRETSLPATASNGDNTVR